MHDKSPWIKFAAVLVVMALLIPACAQVAQVTPDGGDPGQGEPAPEQPVEAPPEQPPVEEPAAPAPTQAPVDGTGDYTAQGR